MSLQREQSALFIDADTDSDDEHSISQSTPLIRSDVDDTLRRNSSVSFFDHGNDESSSQVKQSFFTRIVCYVTLSLSITGLVLLAKYFQLSKQHIISVTSRSIDPLASQSSEHTANQSISPSFNQSINQSVNQSSSGPFVSIKPIRLNETIFIYGIGLDTLFNQTTNNLIQLTLNDVDCLVISYSDSYVECQINQPIDHVTKHEISVAHVVYRSFHQTNSLIEHTNNSTNSQATTQPFNQLISQSNKQSIDQSINQSIDQSLPLIRIFTHWEKANIVLVLHYNSMWWLLQRGHMLAPYYKLFPKVLIVSPENYPNDKKNYNPPAIDLICKHGLSGIESYVCLGEISRLYPEYNGWLQLHFDCLIDFIRLIDYPIDQFWSPVIDHIGSKYQDHIHGVNATWHWPKIRDGVENVYFEIDQIINGTHLNNQSINLDTDDQSINQSIYQTYKDNYIRNLGSFDNWVQSFADVFYLPKRYANDWQRFTLIDRIFDRSDVYVEIAYGLLINLIAQSVSDSMTIIPGVWSYDAQVIIDKYFQSIDQSNNQTNNKRPIYFHQIHFDMPIGRDMIKTSAERALTRWNK